MDEDTLYRIKCPDCRLELHWDDEAFAQWKQGPTKCPQCGAALGDMMADEVPLSSKPDFKPEVGQSLRWSFAMQVGRTFALRTDDVMRLLEMLKNYDKDRGEELRKLGEGPAMDEATFNTMADEFQALQGMTDRELELLLLNANRAPAGNRLDAVMENMRRQFGDQVVSGWVRECGKRGIVT